jgi:GTPase SAR1 family protein
MQDVKFEKVVFLGDSEVGKSKLIESLASASYFELGANQDTQAGSICPEPSRAVLQYRNLHFACNKIIQIWDSEEYRRPGIFRKIYLQRTKVYIIMFDANQATSFANCQQYLDMVKDSKSPDSQILLVASTVTNSQRQVSTHEAEEWSLKNSCFYLETLSGVDSGQNVLSKLEEMLEKANCLE